MEQGAPMININRWKHSRNCAVLCHQRGCPDKKIAQHEAIDLKISHSPFNRPHMNPFKCIITSCKVHPLLSLSFGYTVFSDASRRFSPLFPLPFPSFSPATNMAFLPYSARAPYLWFDSSRRFIKNNTSNTPNYII